MKRFGKIFFGLVVFFVVVLIGVQIFGVKYLNKAVDKFVLPQVEDVTGVDVVIKDLSLNLFRGTVNVEGVVIGNPEGYKGDLLTIGEFTTDLKIAALFKREIYVTELKLKDVHLAIMSKGAQSLNVLDLANHISGANTKEQSGQNKQVKTANEEQQVAGVDEGSTVKSAEPIDFKLQDSAFNFLFSFVLLPGEYITKEYSLEWNLVLEAKNITNMDGETSPGSIKILSGPASKTDAPQIDIDALIYPLTDIAQPSFQAHGNVLNFNMLDIAEWCEQLGVGSSNLDIKINMVCEKGIYTNESNIEFNFQNPKLYGHLADQAGNVQLPKELKVKVPVKGSWNDPKIDLKPALTKMVFEVTKSTLINKYVPEEYKETAKDIGDTLQEGLDNLFKKKDK